MTTPSIYVGTYAKYNNGSIFGAWLDLTEYDDAEDFYKACAELHKDEQDPEFMFHSLYGQRGLIPWPTQGGEDQCDS